MGVWLDMDEDKEISCVHIQIHVSCASFSLSLSLCLSVYRGHPEFPCLSLWPFLPVDRVCKVMMAAVFPIMPVLHKKSCVYCIFVHETQQTIQKTGGIM